MLRMAIALLPLSGALALLLPSAPAHDRRQFLVAASSLAVLRAPPASAAYADEKQRNLPPAKLAKIVTEDITHRQFLVSGRLTRSIYDESCTFQDEIDTYTLDKWMVGTQKLFDESKSHVDIVGQVEATESEVRFRFDEILCFNLPLIKPKIPLTGTLVLTRGEDGLITKYREIWDISVVESLKRAYL